MKYFWQTLFLMGLFIVSGPGCNINPASPTKKVSGSSTNSGSNTSSGSNNQVTCAVCGDVDNSIGGCVPGTYADAPDTQTHFLWYCENQPNRIGSCGGDKVYKICQKAKSESESGSESESESESESGSESGSESESESTLLTNTLELKQTGSKKKLDILFVIDHGTDMDTAQEKLGENFNALKSSLESSDWQMAFVNGSKGDGKFYALEDEDGPIEVDSENIYILKPDMEGLEELFEYTVYRGSKNKESGSRPLQSITKAFDVNSTSSQDPDKVDFFREDASLAVILLTNKGDTLTPSFTINTVIKKLGHDRFIAYGFFASTAAAGDSCPSSNPSSHLKVKQLAIFTQGILGDFCARMTQYAQKLKEISSHLKTKLVESDLSIQNEIPLMQNNIIENSIEITFDPLENTVGWSFDSETNKILLDKAPVLDTQITVTYNYTQSSDEDTDKEDEEEN